MFFKLVEKLEDFIIKIELQSGFSPITGKTTELRREMSNILNNEAMKLAGAFGSIIENNEWDRMIACAKAITLNRAERQSALDKLLSFAKDGGKTALYLINKERFCVQLFIRILDPNKIDQGVLGMCGPTTIVGTIIKRSPDVFAEAAIDLVTTGTTTKLVTPIKVPSTFTFYGGYTATCPEVDWVFLLAMKDSPFWAQMVMSPNDFGSSTLYDIYAMYEKTGLFSSLLFVNLKAGVARSKGTLTASGADATQRFNHAGTLAADKSVTVVLSMPGVLCQEVIPEIHPNTYHLYKSNHVVILKKIELCDIYPVLGALKAKLEITTWTRKMKTGEIPIQLLINMCEGYIAAKI